MAPASDGSAYQEYVLTPKGRGIFPILVALRQWSEEFDERPEQIATILVDRETGKPVKQARALFAGRPAAHGRRHCVETARRGEAETRDGVANRPPRHCGEQQRRLVRRSSTSEGGSKPSFQLAALWIASLRSQ